LRACAIVPAYDAERSVAGVVRSLREAIGGEILVVDDGSSDATAAAAREAGASVVVHPVNRGKGAALCTGFAEAARLGFDVAVTVDADGQHPASAAKAVLEASSDPRVLVLGVRDMVGAGAPPANIWSNGVSNMWVRLLSHESFRDTQCGLRRYPIAATLALAPRSTGYAYEAEIIFRAVVAGIPIVEVEVDVIYAQGDARVTHFDSVRDPIRIGIALIVSAWDLHDLPARTYSDDG
jgi:glycosyltransferase involved in cell wall biosynthesis